MIILNGVTLNDDLLWTNEFDHSEITQIEKRTIGGTLIVDSFPKIEGREINLASVRLGNEFSGRFTRTEIQAFKELELNVTPVTFNYNGQVFNVIVKSGGVQVRPLLARPDQESTDYYTGTLILVTV